MRSFAFEANDVRLSSYIVSDEREAKKNTLNKTPTLARRSVEEKFSAC